MEGGMKDLALLLVHWTHLAATVVWIGGIAFILLVAMPSCRQILGSEAGRVTGELARRFTPLANWSILLLVVTGVILTGTGDRDAVRSVMLLAKHALVCAMIAVHFYRGLRLAPRIARSVSDAERSALQRLSLNLVKLNLGAGLAVLLLSAHYQAG